MNTVLRILLLSLPLVACSGRGSAEPLPRAACATAHPAATRACLDLLAAGGNAMDAAVAASAALAVVEPTGSGMGGGGFWLLHRAEDGFETFIDGRETAPLAARLEHYLDEQGEPVAARSLHGALAAGIPGQPAALAHLAERYGRLPLADSLAPAERLAAEGFVVDALLAEAFARHWSRFDDGARAHFAIDGRAPQAGETLRQPDLAALFAALRREGAAAFYRGAYAERLVAGVRAAGGHWQIADLQTYRVIERRPLVFHFRDARIVSAPPPSAGGVALAQIFGQLELLGLRLPLAVEDAHLVVEAMRRAYRDRARFLGDPDHVFIPQQALLSRSYLRRLAGSIDPGRATASEALGAVPVLPAGEDTTHLSVIDAEGNRVAATLSINIPFGAAMMVPGTGLLLNNELDDFALSTRHSNVYGLVGSEPNLFAPGRRPLSSMTPSFVESPRGVLVVGTPGGSRIITMVALAVLEWLGGAPLETVAAAGRYHHQFSPDRVQVEPALLDSPLAEALHRRGHVVQSAGRAYGNLQAVALEARSGAVEAASDPRGVGQAAVLSP